jgi:AmmeMemoRadiSam system protein B
VAGSFYPGKPTALRRSVDALLEQARPHPADPAPRIYVVPHAGYVYSGPVAAVAYRNVRDLDEPPPRVALLGPSHFVRFAGLALPGVAALATPLGEVPVDALLLDAAVARPPVVAHPAAHATEHSLEVQLPFLQRVLPNAAVLPLLTGEVGSEDAAGVLDDLLDVPGTLGVISSDLSHYLDAAAARRRDEATARAILDLQAEAIAWEDACGRTAVQAALLVARRRGWGCRLLALTNSADTAGTPDRVVGYGAFALGPV